jgi:hypothetical protein
VWEGDSTSSSSGGFAAEQEIVLNLHFRHLMILLLIAFSLLKQIHIQQNLTDVCQLKFLLIWRGDVWLVGSSPCRQFHVTKPQSPCFLYLRKSRLPIHNVHSMQSATFEGIF